MQPDRFTIKSQEALQAAQRLADERRNPQTTPEHLLAVLLEQPDGIVAPVLRKLGFEPAAVRATLGPALDQLPRSTGTAAPEPAGGSSELVQILRTAESEMRELKDEYVSTEHLLGGRLRPVSSGPSPSVLAGSRRVAGHDALSRRVHQRCAAAHRVTSPDP